ncbi:MAG: glycoside hydrolase family 3 N-terminal domain-containing protein [bacterium]
MPDMHQLLGQLFIVGYQGIDPKTEFLDFVAELQLGGVILFGENCTDVDRLQQALHTLRRQVPTDRPLLVAIDQEGGRTCRLQEKRALLYSATSYAKRNDLEGFTQDYHRAAEYMLSLGVNLNLAPVADILLNPDNSCLAGRCYGKEPQQVANFVTRAVELMHRSHMLCCLKHFPGLGQATIDPHLAVAEAAYDLATWTERERIPFAAGIKAGADMVMTTHLKVPAIDQVIATGSSAVVNGLLRQDLGFDGVVITDEMAMLGADALGDMGARTVAALQAGHDIVLFGQNLANARRAYEAVSEAVSSRQLSPEVITRALDRVANLKQRLISQKAV